ncbi:MAG: PAS domain S-box protein [Bryobacteraceae bacterium]
MRAIPNSVGAWFRRLKSIGWTEVAAWKWLPVFIGLFAFAAILFFGRAVKAREKSEIRKTLALVSDSLKSRILSGIQTRVTPLEKMATRWSVRDMPLQQEWESDATLFFGSYPAYDSIQWVDPSYNTRWAVPLRQDWATDPDNLVRSEASRPAFQRARKARLASATPVMPLSHGGKGFLVAAPAFRKNELTGYMVGTFHVRELLASILNDYVPAGYWVSVLDGSDLLYQRSKVAVPARPADLSEVSINVMGMPWTVRVGPTPAGSMEFRSNLPDAVLLTGVLLGLLLSFTTVLGQTSHRRAKALERANAELEQQITQRKQWGEALRQAKERLETVIRTSPLAMVSFDPHGRITSWNPTAERMLGWKEQEILHESLPSPGIEQRDDLRKLTERPAESEPLAGMEGRCQRKDGSWLEVAIWTAPLMGTAGSVSGFMAVLADISEQKRLQDQLRDSQKMEMIGRLAGGVAHDFNNLLTVINGYSRMLLESLPVEDPHHERAEEILKAGNRAASLTGQLLAISRRQLIQPKVLNLNHVVANISKMLSRLIGEHIELKTVLDSDLGPVKADPSQIEQVLINLATNARDAMPSGGVLTIETENAEIDEEEGYRQQISPGPYVKLTISDTGTGMDPEIRRHVFEPFYTTKGRGKGTGLGLSSVYGSVKQNQGSIVVSSEPGSGSVFSIYLPRLAGVTETAATETPTPRPTHGTETILLVEDETALRGMVRQMLETLGYRVMDAADGLSAIHLCDGRQKPVDLLVTDVVMPLLNGREVAKRLTRKWPGMKVVYMSGYTDDVIAYHGVADASVNLIQKPFRMEALAAKIREVLDHSPSPAPK